MSTYRTNSARTPRTTNRDRVGYRLRETPARQKVQPVLEEELRDVNAECSDALKPSGLDCDPSATLCTVDQTVNAILEYDAK